MGMIGEPNGVPMKIAEPQKMLPVVAPVKAPEREPVTVGR